MCVPPRAQIKLGSRCLQIDNSHPGTKPTVSECTGGDNQLFGFFQDFGHSFVHSFYIRPKLSKMCLEVEDGASDDGANIQQWECHGGANQRFIPGRLGWSRGVHIDVLTAAQGALPQLQGGAAVYSAAWAGHSPLSPLAVLHACCVHLPHPALTPMPPPWPPPQRPLQPQSPPAGRGSRLP